MKYDVILAGVGGQGVLSLAAIIANGAMKEGLFVRQSEVHGNLNRGIKDSSQVSFHKGVAFFNDHYLFHRLSQFPYFSHRYGIDADMQMGRFHRQLP
ncbi:unnamed protein product [marine sediment metagenome]|uniref:Pyruvate/ketoisovalerate oxidoreductase catalytic domain-containing protein n=1 Tax=marine sediment metagenome TaxID=412755 RepID=X1IDP7_9ZZZZ